MWISHLQVLATLFTHLILIDLITVTIFGEVNDL
jgi:hypothetical protein